ncbi:unnamed protein product, partial [Sphenostylis stenocarpa]
VLRRRGHTINANLQKKRAKLTTMNKKFDIQFPPPYYKLCGKHAKYFKVEATVCIRQKAPLRVKTWKEISEDDLAIMWNHMKKEKLKNDEWSNVCRSMEGYTHEIRWNMVYSKWRRNHV